MQGPYLEPCRQLLLRKAAADAQDSDGGSALHGAARAGSLALCELILSWGAAVNLSDNDGWRPLHEAARTMGLYPTPASAWVDCRLSKYYSNNLIDFNNLQ